MRTIVFLAASYAAPWLGFRVGAKLTCS